MRKKGSNGKGRKGTPHVRNANVGTKVTNTSMTHGKALIQQNLTLTRCAWTPKAKTLALSQESLLYPGEGVQGGTALSYSLNDFMSSDIYSNWEKFRFKSVTVYAKYRPVTGSGGIFQAAPIDVFYAYDPDTFNQFPGWKNMTERNQTRMTQLNPFTYPIQKLGSFKFRAQLKHDQEFQNVSNWVPEPHHWFDTNAANQQFGNVVLWAQCNKYNQSGPDEFEIDFYAQAEVEFSCAI